VTANGNPQGVDDTDYEDFQRNNSILEESRPEFRIVKHRQKQMGDHLAKLYQGV